MPDDTALESLLEELCESQIKEQELEEQAAKIAQNKDPEELNDLPRLYRLEIKRLLNDQGETELAAQIQD